MTNTRYRSRPTTPLKMSPFAVKVIAIVKRVPRGKVATYGQIARLAGKPHGARGVGWILSACAEAHGLPWQRVLNSKGGISFHPKSSEYREQRRALIAEGIEFLGRTGSLDLALYGWKKAPRRDPRKPQMYS